MPRVNRHFLPGYVWHHTRHCYHKTFLLKFARDRRRYLRWVFETLKRFGFPVLNSYETPGCRGQETPLTKKSSLLKRHRSRG